MGKTMNDTTLAIHFALPAVASPFLIGVKFVFLPLSAVPNDMSTRWTGGQTVTMINERMRCTERDGWHGQFRKGSR